MINIEEKSLSALISRLDVIKAELAELENDIRALAEAAPVAEDIPVVDDIPATEDIPVADLAPVPEPAEEPIEVVEPEPEPAPEPEPEPASVEEPVVMPESVEEQPIDIIPEDDSPIDIDIPEFPPVPEPVEVPRKTILDTAKADTAVMDVMAEKQAWRTDRPGMPVKNIISAISLNDRVLLINVLFDEDPMLFQETIAKFNAMGSLSEALAYIAENHPGWDMNSEPVYRLMMAVRRKLS